MAKGPQPVNPYAQGAADQASQLGAAVGSSIINNPNEVNPYGSVTNKLVGYETTYDAQGRPQYVPRYERNVQFSPDQMKLLGLQTQGQYNLGQTAVEQSSKIRKLLGTSMNTEGLQPWQMAAAPGQIRQDQGATDRPAIEQAMLARYRENAGKSQSAEDAQLAARGLNPGSAHYGQVADTRERALTDASQQAYLASGQEARAAQAAYNQAEQQRYQEGSDWAAQANNLRQAQFGERAALRNQTPNEISALLSGSQVTVPQFAPFSRQGINAPNVGQYMGDAGRQQQQSYSDMLSGLFGVGSAAMSMFGGPAGAGGGFMSRMFA
jgi:hypothetical protein